MQLRNRKTHEIIKSGLFANKKKTTILVEEVNTASSNLNQQPLTLNPDPYSISAFLKTLGTSMLQFGLPSVLLLTLGYRAAAAVTNLQAYSGQPNGGLDLCKDIYQCVQGYLANNGEWEDHWPQFNAISNKILNQLKHSENDGSGQLLKCMSVEKIGNLVKNAFREANNTEPCFASSGEWENAQITSQVRNLSPKNCVSYQNAFGSEAQLCMNSPFSQTEAILIGAAVFAVFLGCYIGAYCWMKRDLSHFHERSEKFFKEAFSHHDDHQDERRCGFLKC